MSCFYPCRLCGDAYHSVAGPDAEDGSARTLPSAVRKKKAVVEFDRDEDDIPILNDPSLMMARVMEPMVRQFLSIHYSESISNQKRSKSYICVCRQVLEWNEDCRGLDRAFREPRQHG